MTDGAVYVDIDDGTPVMGDVQYVDVAEDSDDKAVVNDWENDGLQRTRPQKIAKALVNTTKRPLDKGAKNAIRRQKYAEQKLVTFAKASGDDKLLAAAVSTPVGKKQMPHLAGLIARGSEHFARVVENTKRCIKTIGRKYKNQFTHLILDGLPASFCKKELGMSQAELDHSNRVDDDKFGPNRDRYGRKALVQILENSQ